MRRPYGSTAATNLVEHRRSEHNSLTSEPRPSHSTPKLPKRVAKPLGTALSDGECSGHRRAGGDDQDSFISFNGDRFVISLEVEPLEHVLRQRHPVDPPGRRSFVSVYITAPCAVRCCCYSRRIGLSATVRLDVSRFSRARSSQRDGGKIGLERSASSSWIPNFARRSLLPSLSCAGLPHPRRAREKFAGRSSESAAVLRRGVCEGRAHVRKESGADGKREQEPVTRRIPSV